MSENPGPKKGAKKVPEKDPQPLSIPKEVDEKQKLLEKTLVIFSEQVTTQVMQLGQIVAALAQKVELLERAPHNDVSGVVREMGVIFRNLQQQHPPEINPTQVMEMLKYFMSSPGIVMPSLGIEPPKRELPKPELLPQPIIPPTAPIFEPKPESKPEK
jgi:hypothetical protein